MPEIQINFVAVIVAVVLNFILGFIWYTPLFGKAWATEMGFDPNEKPEGSVMARGMIFMVVGNFFLAYVFAHNIAVWDPMTWGQGPSEMSKMANIANAAFFTWLGFFLPIDLGGVAWEKKSWKLFGINTGYHLLSLIVVAAVLIYM
ncbi:MAG: DUF1761 domain-containing protein [Reichenbachiella sp.]|uniref:DUF1761 domain-containing protein n=1 Tax=Reichenbachiella sp. TaxID=2184521 RepID=UPI0032659D5A